jgi:esterase
MCRPSDRVRLLVDVRTSRPIWSSTKRVAGSSRSISSTCEAVFGDELDKARARARVGLLEIHTVTNAAHWVHVDNPAGLLEVLVPTRAR